MHTSDNIYVGKSKIPAWGKSIIFWNVIVISVDVIVYQIAPVNLFHCVMIYVFLWWFTGIPFIAEKFMYGLSKEETRIDRIYQKKLIKRHIGVEEAKRQAKNKDDKKREF